SLAPGVRGEMLPEVSLFAELPAPYDQVSVRRGSRKWIVHEKTGEVEAFTDDDPREEHSVASLGPEGAALVADYRKTCPGRRAASAATPPLDAVDPSLVREKLRALGYIQ